MKFFYIRCVLLKRSIEMTNWNSNDDNNNHNPHNPGNFDEWDEPNPGNFDEWDEPNQNYPMDDPPSPSTLYFASSIEDLSEEAQRFINQHFDRHNIQRVRESMEADGYDNEGPLAKIWELLIQTNDGMIHFFSYENRYRPDELPGYRAN